MKIADQKNLVQFYVVGYTKMVVQNMLITSKHRYPPIKQLVSEKLRQQQSVI